MVFVRIVLLLSVAEFLLCSASFKVDEKAKFPSLHKDSRPGLPGGASDVDLNSTESRHDVRKIAQRAVDTSSAEEEGNQTDYHVIRIKEASTAVAAGPVTRIVFFIGECESKNESKGGWNKTIKHHSSEEDVHHSNSTKEKHGKELPFRNNTETKNNKDKKGAHEKDDKGHDKDKSKDKSNSKEKSKDKKKGGESKEESNESKEEKRGKCKVKHNGQVYQCYAKTIEQPWINVFKVLEFYCKSSSKKEAHES